MVQTLLFLHSSAELYGADRTLLDLVGGLDPQEYRAVVVLPRPGPLVAALRDAGAQVEMAPLGIGARSMLTVRGFLAFAFELPRAVTAVRRIIRRHRPSVVHTNTMTVLGGALAARTKRVPHVWHVHEIPTQPWLARVCAAAFDRLATRVVCNSRATADCFQRVRPRLERKLTVVWNGTERTPSVVHEQAAQELRAALGMEDDQPLVLLIGRFNSWKGQSLLLDAVERNRERLPRARYLLLGDAPPGQEHFATSLGESIRDRGLVEIVHVRPFEEDPGGAYAAADLVVVPSTRPEPFGLVAVEAMAFERPVVAANHGGVAEIVVDGETGRLFPPGDADALAHAIADVAEHDDAARDMGAAGARRQRGWFSLERYRAGFRDLYRELAPGRLPAATKVVHVILGKANPARLNGVNVVLHQLASAQKELGYDVEVWGLARDLASATPARSYTLRVFQRARARFSAGRDFARAVREERGSCIFHLHGGFVPELYAVERLLARAGHPFVISPHGAYRTRALEKNRFAKALYLRLFERGLLRRARAVQAFAQRDAEETARQVDRERVVVVPNGQAVPSTMPRSIRAEAARPVFAYCGRLSTYTKGLDVLLEGFGEYAASGRRGSLRIIGDGPDDADLRGTVQRLNLEGRVQFCGALFGEAKLAELLDSDVAVLTSRHEGMPTAILEAAALGCALLVTDETNVAAQVREYDCGYVLDENSAAGAAAALRRAESDFEDRTLADRGDWAERMAIELFSWSNIAEAVVRDLYGMDADTRDDSKERLRASA